MAFNINTFLQNMTEDGYRPNLFEVRFTFPGAIDNLAASQNVRFKTKSTTIPSSDIGVASVYFYGREIKFAGNREFGSWQMTIMMDEPDFEKVQGARGIFELWSSYLNSHYTNVRNNSFKSPRLFGTGYFGSAKIIPLSKIGPSALGPATDAGTVGSISNYSGISLESYEMVGCYPTDIGEISLDWQDNNRIAEFTVTFEYQYWMNTAEVLAV